MFLLRKTLVLWYSLYFKLCTFAAAQHAVSGVVIESNEVIRQNGTSCGTNI
jgi:hypothetical protein